MTQQATSDPSADDRLQAAAGDIAQRTSDTVGRQLDGQLDTQLTKAGSMLQGVAEAIRRGGEEMRDQQPQVAGAADTAASQVERFAEHIRQRSPRDLVNEVEQFARQQPAVFIGGALLVGAVAARLLKASPQTGSGVNAGYRGSTSRSGYGVDSPYGGAYGTGGAAYGGAYGTGGAPYGGASTSGIGSSYGSAPYEAGAIGDGGK